MHRQVHTPVVIPTPQITGSMKRCSPLCKRSVSLKNRPVNATRASSRRFHKPISIGAFQQSTFSIRHQRERMWHCFTALTACVSNTPPKSEADCHNCSNGVRFTPRIVLASAPILLSQHPNGFDKAGIMEITLRQSQNARQPACADCQKRRNTTPEQQ